MGHSHSHAHNDTGEIKVAFFLNLSFTILEFVGGALINSTAIMSDALHDLGDSLSLGLAWFLSNYSQKPGNDKYSYGYRRFSLLGAFINAIVLIIGSVLVLSEAIPRLSNPESFSASGMVIFALIGIAVNGFAVWRLRGSQTANAQVVGWHLLEDVLGWVAILIVGVISLFVDVPILDPILSILITLYVLFNVLRRLKDVTEIFLQAVPEEIDLGEIALEIEAIQGVESIHHLHIWSLDGQHAVFTVHLVVDEDAGKQDIQQIKRQTKAILKGQQLEFEHIAIEVEHEDCLLDEEVH